MANTDFFELNSWGLKNPASRNYARAAYSHCCSSLSNSPIPSDWPFGQVDPCHLFACGVTAPGTRDGAHGALKLLLSNGARIDAVDASGWTPLSYAAWFGLASTLDILLEAGASVHPKNSPPPLFAAMSSFAQRSTPGSETCARLLLMAGAEPLRCSISDTTGRSSFLSWALANDRIDWATILHARGDHIRSERELLILTWQASAESLDWLQTHDYDVLSSLPVDHAHRHNLLVARSARNREALSSLARSPSIADGFLDEDQSTRAI